MDLTKEAYDKAIEVLQKCSTPHGFYAAYPGYNMVFARDSMITSLGASLFGPHFKETFEKSLLTLASKQSKKGQIPNAVDLFSERKNHVDFQSIDSTLWFIIGCFIHRKRFPQDIYFFEALRPNIDKALTWISYQDMSEDSLLEQLPTTDWQDAFPHRYGHTINTQALWYKVLCLTRKTDEAELVKNQVNKNQDICLWNGNFYLPYRWKNHGKYKEKGEWFDSLGNLLAIIFDLADKKQAESILSHIKRNKIAYPVPMKSIYPPIKHGSKDWYDYFSDCGARTPYHYSNAGIWTFIGGFYVLALIKQKHYDEAKKSLSKIAEANIKYNFSEWLNGKTGKIGKSQSGSQEGNQAWNAGMYILAYESLKAGKVLL